MSPTTNLIESTVQNPNPSIYDQFYTWIMTALLPAFASIYGLTGIKVMRTRRPFAGIDPNTGLGYYDLFYVQYANGFIDQVDYQEYLIFDGDPAGVAAPLAGEYANFAGVTVQSLIQAEQASKVPIAIAPPPPVNPIGPAIPGTPGWYQNQAGTAAPSLSPFTDLKTQTVYKAYMPGMSIFGPTWVWVVVPAEKAS